MKQQPDYLPINFSLTERATEMILAVNQQCRKEKGIDSVPAMCWLMDGTDEQGRWQTLDSPHIGFYARSDVPKEAIQNVEGLELIFSVSPDVATKFKDQVIDYSDHKGFYFLGAKL